jgi:crotonobetainyl-CoA:carnitine CoA-transferase CaiB-like acyl-CoA transferase
MPALTGIRVVELAESVAGEYCGRLVADFGAEVIKVEAPGRGSQRPILGPSWQMSRTPARIARGAPDLGEDTEYVLHEILGARSMTGGT